MNSLRFFKAYPFSFIYPCLYLVSQTMKIPPSGKSKNSLPSVTKPRTVEWTPKKRCSKARNTSGTSSYKVANTLR